MQKNDVPAAPSNRRVPRQDRSQQKVELMLEAATRLLEQHEPAQVSTNAIAKLAGVSIGTLYQYFPDKDALFQALTRRELGGLSKRVREIVIGPVPERPGGRITAVIGAVLDTYGGREITHRRLMQYAIERGTSGSLGPLLMGLVSGLTRVGVSGPSVQARPMSSADAFVLTYAMAGVLRAAVSAEGNGGPGRQQLEESLTRLVLNFLQPMPATPSAGRAPGNEA